VVRAGKWVAIYCRVSTKDKGQTTENQRIALEQWAANAGCSVVATFEDTGAKGRDKRPLFDALLKAAVRREFGMFAMWSSDRLGRSMSHLIEVLETIKGTGVALYIRTQALDTTTPAGRTMFQMLGVFAEFEREMIRPVQSRTRSRKRRCCWRLVTVSSRSPRRSASAP
jgi:DNA invertase Pin-like site-specific DNA recombinase